MMEDFKKILFKCIPYLPVFYIGNKVAWLYRIIPFFTAPKKIYYIFMHSGQLFQGPLISMKMNDIFYGVLFALLVRGIVYILLERLPKPFRYRWEYMRNITK